MLYDYKSFNDHRSTMFEEANVKKSTEAKLCVRKHKNYRALTLKKNTSLNQKTNRNASSFTLK